ncbi:MAG: polysaccharide deacetylase family protein [bacterium]|nr:polysaccharide deacetylase family protein [bacterium]
MRSRWAGMVVVALISACSATGGENTITTPVASVSTTLAEPVTTTTRLPPTPTTRPVVVQAVSPEPTPRPTRSEPVPADPEPDPAVSEPLQEENQSDPPREIEEKPVEQAVRIGSPLPTGDPIRFPDGEQPTTVGGTLSPGEKRSYLIEALAYNEYTVTLGAPTGVVLRVGLPDQVVTPPGGGPRRVSFVLPESRLWVLEVESTLTEPVDYELTTGYRPFGHSPSGSVVHLTFDDGPHPVHTVEILDVLRRYGARATFFVVGRMVERFPDLLDRILLEGHTVANHTWNHENLTKLSVPDIDQTIGRAQEILGDYATACFRPPYAALNELAAERTEAHGLEVVMWDYSGADWLDVTAEEIADRIVRGAVDGAVILLHDGGGDRSRTVQGLEMALERLSARSVRFEPVCLPAETESPELVYRGSPTSSGIPTSRGSSPP